VGAEEGGRFELPFSHLGEEDTSLKQRLRLPENLAGVIKNKGYGMGVAHAARLLEPLAEVYGFAVVKLHEAATLRDAGVRKPILLMGPFDEKSLKEGIRLGRKHAASSFGLFQHPGAFFDMARPGMAIYGIYPEKEFRSAGIMDLRPALSLKARVIYTKKLRRGESAGYNRAYVAKDDVWVATLPVGHADGWPRQAAKGAPGDNHFFSRERPNTRFTSQEVCVRLCSFYRTK
jgi:alanine racemase